MLFLNFSQEVLTSSKKVFIVRTSLLMTNTKLLNASSLKIYRRTDKSGHLSLRAKAKDFKFKKLASSEANGVGNTPSKPKRRVRATTEIKQKSLILAQIERWRNALHMQVER